MDEDWVKLQLCWHKFRQCLRAGSIRVVLITTEEEESKKQDCNYYSNSDESTIKAILKLTTGTVFSMQKMHFINPSKIKW